MKRLAAFLLLSTAGCSGFAAPTSSDFETLRISERPASEGIDRLKFRMSVEGGSLAGEYDGVALIRHDASGPTLRLQLFSDVGPKMIELSARRDRIVGHFPQTGEAVDCALPGEAAPHPILFIGASLVERFTEVTRSRVIAVREAEEGYWWLKLRPAIDGMSIRTLRNPFGWVRERRFTWMYGLGWTETWVSDPLVGTIRAPGMALRVQDVQEGATEANPSLLEFRLPDDARIVQGSRK